MGRAGFEVRCGSEERYHWFIAGVETVDVNAGGLHRVEGKAGWFHVSGCVGDCDGRRWFPVRG